MTRARAASALKHILRAIIWFAKWYWARVKEFPLVVGSFSLGGIYVAALLTIPRLLAYATRLM